MAKRRSQLKKFIGRVQELGKYELEVGLPRSVGSQPKLDRDLRPTDYTLAQVAGWNEFGTSTIPARPAFRQAARSREAKLAVRALLEAFKDIPLYARRSAVLPILEPIAEELATIVRKHVKDYAVPRNAISTIETKGFNDPLVQTGQLKRAISTEIRRSRRKVKTVRGRG